MPHKFTDANGREYTVSLTLGSVREVRNKFAIDVFNDNDWTKLMSSLLDRLTYVWWLVKDQADAFGVGIEDFDRALCGGDHADQASDAFLDELIFFYADLQQAKLNKLTKAYRNGTKLEREKFATQQFEDLLNQTISGATSSMLPQSSE